MYRIGYNYPLAYMTNNRAIAISGFSGDDSLTGMNGLTITVAPSRQYAACATDTGWNFGTDEANPRVWGLDPAYPLPTLYWQTQAPALPAHLSPG